MRDFSSYFFSSIFNVAGICSAIFLAAGSSAQEHRMCYNVCHYFDHSVGFDHRYFIIRVGEHHGLARPFELTIAKFGRYFSHIQEVGCDIGI